MEEVIIFDTTLRDGEQAAGMSLNLQEKLEIARQLDKLGVDVIEAGFPASSIGDFEAVGLVAWELKRPIACALTLIDVEAVDRAINRIIAILDKLRDFTARSTTKGIDAIGEVLIRIESQGVTYTGPGAAADIIVACAKAHSNALNRLLSAKKV